MLGTFSESFTDLLIKERDKTIQVHFAFSAAYRGSGQVAVRSLRFTFAKSCMYAIWLADSFLTQIYVPHCSATKFYSYSSTKVACHHYMTQEEWCILHVLKLNLSVNY